MHKLSISGHRLLKRLSASQAEGCKNAINSIAPVGTLLSGLAEGADQFVTKIALDLGWHVTAVLPMPLAEYEKDFKEQNAIAHFQNLLACCHSIIEIPATNVIDPDIQLSFIPRNGLCLEQQYRNLGRYLVEHAQTMLLLWDGDASAPKPGGTAEVKLMCDAALARRDDPDWYGVRQVIHIPVERGG